MSELYAMRRTGDKNQEDWQLIQQADPALQESLQAEAEYDEMNAEQTWPNEEELKEAQIVKLKKKVPKGTSAYQAAWILDSEEVKIWR
jgi:pre-rRNA-processing protein TSR1